MKTLLLIAAATIIMMNSCNGNTNFSQKEIIKIQQDMNLSLKNIQLGDTLLNNIEQKILNAFTDTQVKKTDNELISLENSLLSLGTKNKNSIIIYWYSFACYYHSISFIIKKDDKNSERILNEGIKQLENVAVKNSEHYALLALMKSFSIQFVAGIKAPFISNYVKENAEKALKLDSLNLRAYFVLGSSDYYTPEQYGGGKKAEAYLKKAISLKDQSIQNQYLPSWGKNSAYELLIKFYIAHKQYDDAKKYYQQAIAIFPNDYMINKLAGELINH